ncbi:MAG: OpgC domain-containing protein [Acidobacteriaceae bacterium]|nr:OpgC domain-containing protein [Acidobacteriaceae bacterium]
MEERRIRNSLAVSTPARGGRIVALDVVRGLCLSEMMVDHVPHNIVWQFLTGAPGFFSAAEGFVFLSGFVGCWTATRALNRGHSMNSIFRRFHSRNLMLYRMYLLLLTMVLWFAVRGGPQFDIWRQFCDVRAGAVQVWLRGAMLLHLPDYLDIFAMYVVFLTAMPVLFNQVRLGRIKTVLLVSLIIWGIAQVWDPSWSGYLLYKAGYFNVLAWQFLYTLGAVLGYKAANGKITHRPRFYSFIVCLVLATLFFLTRHVGIAQYIGLRLPVLDSSSLAYKPKLGVLRVLNFLVVAYCVWYVMLRFGQRLSRKYAYRQFALLGQHSLQVFSWSVAVTYISFLSGRTWIHIRPSVQLLIVALVVMSLWIPAHLHARWSKWVRESRNTRSICELPPQVVEIRCYSLSSLRRVSGDGSRVTPQAHGNR